MKIKRYVFLKRLKDFNEKDIGDMRKKSPRISDQLAMHARLRQKFGNMVKIGFFGYFLAKIKIWET